MGNAAFLRSKLSIVASWKDLLSCSCAQKRRFPGGFWTCLAKDCSQRPHECVRMGMGWVIGDVCECFKVVHVGYLWNISEIVRSCSSFLSTLQRLKVSSSWNHFSESVWKKHCTACDGFEHCTNDDKQVSAKAAQKTFIPTGKGKGRLHCRL